MEFLWHLVWRVMIKNNINSSGWEYLVIIIRSGDQGWGWAKRSFAQARVARLSEVAMGCSYGLVHGLQDFGWYFKYGVAEAFLELWLRMTFLKLWLKMEGKHVAIPSYGLVMVEPRVVACGNKGYLKVIIWGCRTWMNMMVVMLFRIGGYWFFDKCVCVWALYFLL